MDPFDRDPRLHRFFSRWETALHELLPAPGWRVLVGVSGGADSVLLAFLLRASAQREPGRLIVAHVHHGLREEADGDAGFVRQMAADWDLPFRESRVPAAQRAAAEGWSLEQAARVERLTALADLARKADCPAVALGHQMNDQAETVLVRILRGTGPRGLGGMEPRRRFRPGGEAEGEPIELLRPLLGFQREELLEIAQRLGLRWIEDRSNRDLRFLRNRVRHEILPRLADYNPRIIETLAQLAGWQRLEDEALSTAVEELRRAASVELPEAQAAIAEHAAREPKPICAPETPPAGEAASRDERRPSHALALDAQALSRAAPALASRVLWRVYQDLAGSEAVLSGRQINQLLDLLRRVPGGPPGEVHLPGAIRARYRRGRILFEFHQPRPGTTFARPSGDAR